MQESAGYVYSKDGGSRFLKTLLTTYHITHSLIIQNTNILNSPHHEICKYHMPCHVQYGYSWTSKNGNNLSSDFCCYGVLQISEIYTRMTVQQDSNEPEETIQIGGKC